VGESGSGKTTSIRALMGLVPASGGTVRFDGQDITKLTGSARRDVWRRMQMVFQDPSASLSPRLCVGAIIAEPLIAHGETPAAARARVAELLRDVGLPPGSIDGRATALSGGQRQRVAIARALALKPDVIVADEPMSALDVSVKAQIAALFLDLRDRTGATFLIVAHDLALMGQIADRLVVMRSGKIVEQGEARQIIEAPQDAYTRALRDACLDPLRIASARKAAS
jgi:ABC-type glutathione transport system ATPase component